MKQLLMATGTMALLLSGCLDEDEMIISSSGNAQKVKASSATPVLKATIDDPSGLPAAAASAAADFDGDGRSDLAVLAADPLGERMASISIYQNPVPCTGTPVLLESYLVSGSACDLAVGDLNNDGVPDLAVAIRANPPFPGRVHIFFRPDTGGNLTQTEILHGFDASRVLLADVTGDGLLDVIAQGGPSTAVVPGACGTPSHIMGGITPAVGDFNEDAIPDIATVRGSDPTVVDLHTWSGGLVHSGTVTFSVPVSDLAAGDMDGDELPDLVAATDTGACVLFGMANFDFTAPTAAGDGCALRVITGDFNGDGRDETACHSFDNGFFLNFIYSCSEGMDYNLGTDIRNLGTGEVNGDTKEELMICAGSVRIYGLE